MQLPDLYNNDAIFDKFDCCLSGDGSQFATGSYRLVPDSKQFDVYFRKLFSNIAHPFCRCFVVMFDFNSISS